MPSSDSETTARAAGSIRIDRLFTDEERMRALIEETAAGLASVPKELSPKWLYDERGSELFEEITRQPEYYLTRCEREILGERAGEIAELTQADTLVELGSGSSEKTRFLLDALGAAGTLRRFVPLDVSESALRASALAIAAEHPGVLVHGIVGDVERHLDLLPRGGRRLVGLLGSTIGNFAPPRRAALLARLAGSLGPDDAFLLGADLVKDVARLEAAYDDDAGVTAAFTRNVLSVLDHELGANFEPRQFAHASSWDPEHEWMDLGLRSLREQRVSIPGLGLEIGFEAGERMRTEISAKFRRERLEAELAAAGLAVERWWTDRRGDFALCLARPA